MTPSHSDLAGSGPRSGTGSGASQDPVGAWAKPSLRRMLAETDRFATVVELVPSRGLVTDEGGRRVLALGRALAENPRIDGLSLTDNPGGGTMLAADTLGTDLLARGQEVIVHLACKDWNRNALHVPRVAVREESTQRPLGGTRDGICEIGEKECIWARAYERLKAHGEEETMLDGPAVIQDNALRGTGAWSNSLLERDHRAERAVPPEAAREEDAT